MNRYFEELYYKHSKVVYNVAIGILKDRQEAEDVVIEVFCKLYICLKNNIEIKNIAPWLCVTAKTTAIDMIRKDRAIPVPEDWDSSVGDFVDSIIQKSFVDSILRDLYRKNEKWFSYMAMHYMLEMTYEEIAKVEETTPDAVKQAVLRAKRYLNKRYNNYSIDATYVVLMVILRLIICDSI